MQLLRDVRIVSLPLLSTSYFEKFLSSKVTLNISQFIRFRKYFMAKSA